jgi:hypothetical protein
MKKIIKLYHYLGCLILLLAAQGCEYLDVVPDNVATIDHAFSDRYTAERYLATCYWYLPRSADPNNNPAYMGSGEFMSNRERMTASLFIARGTQSAADHQINLWGGGNGGHNLWNGIRDCNIFLENIQKVNDLTLGEKNRWIAEVKFLKAYYHFYLLRYYGPIHIMDQNLDVASETDVVRMVRLPIDECFGYVTELMTEIIQSEHLPMISDRPRQELGRITQPIAKAIFAKVMVTWASPLFNGNNEYAHFKNAEGNAFFSQNKNQERWDLAAQACKDAIDAATQVGHRLFETELLTTTNELSEDSRFQLAFRSALSERWNPEIIWGNSNSSMNGNFQRNMIPHLQPVNGSVTAVWYSPTMNLAELFYTENGVPIEEDVEYDYANRYLTTINTPAVKPYNVRDGGLTANMHYGRENRFYASFGFDRGKWYNLVGERNWVARDVDAPNIAARFNEYSSMYNPFEYSATGYFAKKLVSVHSGFVAQHDFRAENYPYPEIRLADLYLLYAEALNETMTQPDHRVFEYIDAVRARAGLKGIVESWSQHSSRSSKYTTQAGMREIIQRERAIELAMEGSHYWDTRRWKTAIRELNRPLKGWNVLKQDAAEYYEVKVLFNQKFSHRDYFAPIPEYEIVRNPALIQNPGW